MCVISNNKKLKNKNERCLQIYRIVFRSQNNLQMLDIFLIQALNEI